MNFKYFKDPDNFSYKMKSEEKCSICNAIGIWFDAGGFYGSGKLNCICDRCLINGELEELEKFTNDVYMGNEEQIREIAYRTPSLSTWQDIEWPFLNNDYCIFEKFASKEDYTNKQEFIESILSSDKDLTVFDSLWSALPDKKIKNIKDGNYNTTVYLFSSNGKKVSTWDAN